MKARRGARQNPCPSQRTDGEDRSAGGHMPELDAFAGTTEVHRVLTEGVADPQRVHGHIRPADCPGKALGRATWGVLFVVVVRLDNLDVPTGRQDAHRLSDEIEQERDSHREVGHDEAADVALAAGRRELDEVVGGEAARAHHGAHARPRRPG